jgi:hypothetical protein
LSETDRDFVLSLPISPTLENASERLSFDERELRGLEEEFLEITSEVERTKTGTIKHKSLTNQLGRLKKKNGNVEG